MKVQNKLNLLGKNSVTRKSIIQKENSTLWILFLLIKTEFKSKQCIPLNVSISMQFVVVITGHAVGPRFISPILFQLVKIFGYCRYRQSHLFHTSLPISVTTSVLPLLHQKAFISTLDWSRYCLSISRSLFTHIGVVSFAL